MVFNINRSGSLQTSSEGLGATEPARKDRASWLSHRKMNKVLTFSLIFAGISFLGLTALISFRMFWSAKHVANENVGKYHKLVNNSTQILADNAEHFEKRGIKLCELSPDSRSELGRGTWSFLHIMASAYPVEPTPEIINDHRLFFQLLPRIYPCADCRIHMKKMFNELPPRLNNRHDFMQWICEAHNRVNARLGKEIFDCNKHDERWDCGCNIVPGQGQSQQKPSAGKNPSNLIEANRPSTHKPPGRNSKKPPKKDHRKSEMTKTLNGGQVHLKSTNPEVEQLNKSDQENSSEIQSQYN